jgi:hypothetical protein
MAKVRMDAFVTPAFVGIDISSLVASDWRLPSPFPVFSSWPGRWFCWISKWKSGGPCSLRTSRRLPNSYPATAPKDAPKPISVGVANILAPPVTASTAIAAPAVRVPPATAPYGPYSVCGKSVEARTVETSCEASTGCPLVRAILLIGGFAPRLP